MSEQFCDICGKEPVRIHVKGQGNYCLKCYNTMNLERTGVDDTFHSPDTMAVWETNGRLHTFHIEHIIMGDTVCWDVSCKFFLEKVAGIFGECCISVLEKVATPWSGRCHPMEADILC